ncbi:unnamed protein product [Phaedon cochleariae]|uniref:Band 4.1 domain-containing protein n=2 Tax=Phaedon cochleariae TaxID=80249 RepID=A0A9N9SGD8_PHACE|nr:unnamed protein product [Phaedon cochleariae]
MKRVRLVTLIIMISADDISPGISYEILSLLLILCKHLFQKLSSKLLKMDSSKSDVNDCQQIAIQTSNHNVTVIPVEFNRNRVYNDSSGDYLVEPYSKTHDDYSQTEEMPGQGSLYSVSQRLAPLNQNQMVSDGGYGDQLKYSAKQNDWDKDKTAASEEINRECLNEQQNDNSNASAPLVNKSTSTSSTCFDQPQTTPICLYLHTRTAVMLDVEDAPTATCDRVCQAVAGCEELGLNKQVALQVFALWMVSPLLELQLKPSHKPYRIRQMWRSLIEKYSHASYNRQRRDEPKLILQRNVFFPQHLEEKIKLLLYEEARHNILEGRYPCEVIHYVMLGGIQARIELGPYDAHAHTIHYFREEQAKYLPAHVRKSATWTWLPISSKHSAEVKLLEQFRRIPSAATNRKLMKKAAFFEGQVEQPVRGLTSLMTHQDIPVLVAINSKCLYIIDDLQCVILLGLRLEEFSWEFARPSREEDPNCLPCLFLQFMVVENGARVSKILQVFSRQASLMDTLITIFVGQLKSTATDETDKPIEIHVNNENGSHSSLILGTTPPTTLPSLGNKLNRLTLATFDENGHCIGQMGSWSLSY